MVLYAGFSIYSYIEQQKNSASIDIIRDTFTPSAILIADTTALFVELRDLLKDSVLAGESGWLEPAKETQDIIGKNLRELRKYPEVVDQNNLDLLIENFSLYYKNSLKFSRLMLADKSAISSSPELIQDMELYYNNTQSLFFALNQEMEKKFKSTINKTSDSLESLLIYSIAISLSTMLFIIVIMLFVAVSTRKSLNELVVIVKDMALGSSDFSQRISRKSNDELGSLIYWFNRLADKLEQDYTNLETISITDQLTQLNNRTRTDSYFPKIIQDSITQEQPLIAVLIDIDHFKSVNDTHGHLIGDKVLQSMAQILKENARHHDFVARWGGEEFIIILPNTSPEEAYNHIDSLRSLIENYTFPDVKNITASFGIAIFVKGDSPESLMGRADKCLYDAKEQGRNRVVIESELTS